MRKSFPKKLKREDMSINGIRFELTVSSLHGFFQEIQNPNDQTIETAQQIATLAKDALSQAVRGDFTGLLRFCVLQKDPCSISTKVVALQKDPHSNQLFLLDLMQIADLYRVLYQLRDVLTDELSPDNFNHALFDAGLLRSRSLKRIEPLITTKDRLVQQFFQNFPDDMDSKAPIVLEILQDATSQARQNRDYSYMLKFHGCLSPWKITRQLKKQQNPFLEEIKSVSTVFLDLFSLYEEVYSRVLFPYSPAKINEELIRLGELESTEPSPALAKDLLPLAKVIPLSPKNKKAVDVFSAAIENPPDFFNEDFIRAAETVHQLLEKAIHYRIGLNRDFSYLLRFHEDPLNLEKFQALVKNLQFMNTEIADLPAILGLYEIGLKTTRLFQEVTDRLLSPDSPCTKNLELIELGRSSA